MVAALGNTVEELKREIAIRDRVIIDQIGRIGELERALEESRRGGKRQAAPFSKGETSSTPKRPGRKSGDSQGRHGHRQMPVGVPDRELEAPLPAGCPQCGGGIEAERVEAQWQVDIPPVTPSVTKFNVAVGHCRDCCARVLRHHVEPTFDARGRRLPRSARWPRAGRCGCTTGSASPSPSAQRFWPGWVST